jgi:hypothetical protein
MSHVQLAPNSVNQILNSAIAHYDASALLFSSIMNEHRVYEKDGRKWHTNLDPAAEDISKRADPKLYGKLEEGAETNIEMLDILALARSRLDYTMHRDKMASLGFPAAQPLLEPGEHLIGANHQNWLVRKVNGDLETVTSSSNNVEKIPGTEKYNYFDQRIKGDAKGKPTHWDTFFKNFEGEPGPCGHFDLPGAPGIPKRSLDNVKQVSKSTSDKGGFDYKVTTSDSELNYHTDKNDQNPWFDAPRYEPSNPLGDNHSTQRGHQMRRLTDTLDVYTENGIMAIDYTASGEKTITRTGKLDDGTGSTFSTNVQDSLRIDKQGKFVKRETTFDYRTGGLKMPVQGSDGKLTEQNVHNITTEPELGTGNLKRTYTMVDKSQIVQTLSPDGKTILRNPYCN